MAGFLLRMLISAFGIWLATELVAGVQARSGGTIFAAAFLLGVVNAFVRPVLTLATLPLTVLTLGLFLLVINAGMLGLVGWLLPGFEVAGFGPALLGSLVVSFTSWLASWYIGPRGRLEAVRTRRRS